LPLDRNAGLTPAFFWVIIDPALNLIREGPKL
jgi:hypothetical protein